MVGNAIGPQRAWALSMETHEGTGGRLATRSGVQEVETRKAPSSEDDGGEAPVGGPSQTEHARTVLRGAQGACLGDVLNPVTRPTIMDAGGGKYQDTGEDITVHVQTFNANGLSPGFFL